MTKLQFRLRGLATIKDIPTGELKRIWECLIEEGWQQSQMYDGFDAWIDYGSFQLRKDRHRLKFEWDNWTEGSIEGKRSTIEALAAKYEKTVSYEWRWSEYDDNVGTV